MTPEVMANELIDELEHFTNSQVKDELAIRVVIRNVLQIINVLDSDNIIYSSEYKGEEYKFWIKVLNVLKNKL